MRERRVEVLDPDREDKAELAELADPLELLVQMGLPLVQLLAVQTPLRVAAVAVVEAPAESVREDGLK